MKKKTIVLGGILCAIFLAVLFLIENSWSKPHPTNNPLLRLDYTGFREVRELWGWGVTDRWGKRKIFLFACMVLMNRYTGTA